MAIALAVGAFAGCATLAGGGGGDSDLPNAGVGPFRKIRAEELGQSRSAPYAMDDDRRFLRDAALLDEDGDPATLPAFGYFAASLAEGAEAGDAPDAIVRHGALDGRSFDRQSVTVLVPEAAWEGGTVGAPAVLRAKGEVLLYYAAAGGIGVARSADGASFTREPVPALAPDAASWEGGAVPSSPSVVLLPDGTFRLFYSILSADDGGRIGEASSPDGVHFSRVGRGPVLAPGDAAPEEGDTRYDDASVSAPFALLGATGEGRPVLRLHYAARDRAGNATIGLAARFLDDGSGFVRAVAPVFGTGESLAPTEPCVVEHGAFALLFATERAGKTKAKQYPAVAVGVAPALVALPAPSP